MRRIGSVVVKDLESSVDTLNKGVGIFCYMLNRAAD